MPDQKRKHILRIKKKKKKKKRKEKRKGKKRKKRKKGERKGKRSRGRCVILRNVLAAFCCRNLRTYITSKCVRPSLRKKRNSNTPGAL
jgi:hypothetical protein